MVEINPESTTIQGISMNWVEEYGKEGGGKKRREC